MIEDLENDLRKTLSECEALLRESGEDFWSHKIESILKNWVGITYHDCEKILSWYGGMGSFNDLLICPQNNHQIGSEDFNEVNQKLQLLQSEISRLSRKLRRCISELN